MNEQEAKVIRLSQENEKLGNMLEQKNREYQQLSQRLADVDQQNRTIKELQDRLAKLTSENVQLTSEITTIQQTSLIQVSRIGQETNELRSKLNSSLQESDDLRRRLAEVDHLNNKMSDYETRLAMLTKEIERLNSVLKTKVEESNTLQNAVREMS
ncbi:MAG: hypothetical protein JST59_02900 [Actinobacteria bacterium]|nr:hypothetical protein [Actinomycetota bacterium]